MTDIDRLLRTAGTGALKKLLKKAVDSHRFAAMEADLRPVMPVDTATKLLNCLTPRELLALRTYLESPDFEQVMLHVIVGRGRPRREADDGSIREELRHGLRLHAGLSAENGYALTDLMLSAITAAVDQSGAPQAVQGQDLAGLAHRATLAVRNNQLLHLVPSLAAFHEQAEAMRRQVAKLHGELRLPHAGVSRSAPWQELYVTPHLDSLPIDELAEPGQRWVILGDPGAGKSTLARWLSYRVAVDEQPRVPFLAILRDLSDALRAGERTLEEHLAAVAKSPYNIPFSGEAIRYLLLNGRAVVLLDGLDELTDLSLRQRVVDLVDGFAELHPLVPIVVTSRRIGYADAPLRSSAFRATTIAPFDVPRVNAYARNWFSLDDGTPPYERQALCEAFVRDSAAIAELRSNPLLLALLCAMYRNERYIPSNRAQVYERCALMLFEQWDSMRGIKMPVRFEGRVRGAVQELAWEMYAERQTLTLARPKVLAIIARFLAAKGIDEDVARRLAADFLEFCAGRAWVLAEVGAQGAEPVYGFAHKTFSEFFTAERLVRREVTPEAVWRVLAAKLQDRGWTVVGQIATHLLERNVVDGADRFVLAALEAPGEQASTATFLAGICAELPLSDRVIEGVVRLAYLSAATVPPRMRAPAIFIDDDSMLFADTALAMLGPVALKGPNVEGIIQAIAGLLGAAILAGDGGACLLADCMLGPDDREPFMGWVGGMSERVAARLGPEHAEARSRWRETSLAGQAYLATDGLTDIDTTVKRAGVAAFYVGIRFWVTNVPPAVTRFTGPATVRDAARLRDHLLRAQTPWLPTEYGMDLLHEEHPETRFLSAWDSLTGTDVATKLVLLLPYLEAIARNDSFDLQPLDPTPRLLAQRRREGAAGVDWWTWAPPGIAVFLRRWVDGEFDVLGDKASAPHQ